jgi:hypothetical protein
MQRRRRFTKPFTAKLMDVDASCPSAFEVGAQVLLLTDNGARVTFMREADKWNASRDEFITERTEFLRATEEVPPEIASASSVFRP